MVKVGILANNAITPWVPQATLYWPFKDTSPNIMVRLSSVWVNIRGHKKSFQIQVNCRVPRTARAGRLMGKKVKSSSYTGNLYNPDIPDAMLF